MRGARSLYFAGSRLLKTSGGSVMWVSTSITQSTIGSAISIPPGAVGATVECSRGTQPREIPLRSQSVARATPASTASPSSAAHSRSRSRSG